MLNILNINLNLLLALEALLTEQNVAKAECRTYIIQAATRGGSWKSGDGNSDCAPKRKQWNNH